MMKKLLVLLPIIALLLSSCQFFAPQKEVVKTGKKSTDGTFIKKRHYNNDPHSPVEWEVSMKHKEGSKTAIKHGVSKRFSKTGDLWETINYVDNKKEGLRTSYHTNGKTYKVQPYTDGRLNGICKRYDRDGKLVAEYEYKNGLAGIGIKRYTNLGKLRPDPVLNIKKIDQLRSNDTYKLSLSISGDGAKSIKSVEYFEGKLIEGKFIHKNLNPAKELSSKKAELAIKVSKGSSINKTFNIIAVCKTSDGLKVILQKNVKVDARGV